METQKKTPLQITVRILIIIGLVILLLLLCFGIIKLVPKAFNSLTHLKTSLLSRSEKIVVTSDPDSLTSGDEAILNWKQTNGPADGYYTFNYSCPDHASSLELKKSEEDAAHPTYIQLECNKSLKIDNASTTNGEHSLPIHAVNISGQEVKTTIKISHRKADDSADYSEGSVTLTIYPMKDAMPATATSTVVTKEPRAPREGTTVPPRTEPHVASSPTVTHYNAGPADLAVSITALGIVDPATYRFIQTTSSTANDLVAIKFQVTNTGGSSSGAWNFVASLPTTIPADQIYTSAYQSSIPPGKTSYFTIGFYGVKNGTNEFRVVADPQNTIRETNESNNIGTSVLTHRP